MVLDFSGSGQQSHLAAHNRWATGLLVDRASVSGGIMLGNNGSFGSGEGWAMGWGVVWNALSDTQLQNPPGAMNWGIGDTGQAATAPPIGTYESANVPVSPSSLYLAQLCDRLGPTAVANIGY